MSGKLYLIRHGEVNSNRENVYIGSTDIELNEKGIEQAQLLAQRLKDAEIDAIYSSSMCRAMRTAEEISKVANIAVIPCPNLRELDYGDWEGVPEEIVRSVYIDQYTKWIENPLEVPVPSGESFGQLRGRVMPAFYEIAEAYRDKCVVIVSHKSTNRVILASLLGMDVNRYRQIGQGNTCLNMIEMRNDGSFVVDCINDQGHLETW